jgi:hypothetical protein
VIEGENVEMLVRSLMAYDTYEMSAFPNYR